MKIEIRFNDGISSKCHALSISDDQVITKDNEAVWVEYITKKISGLITPETMASTEFRSAEDKVRKDLDFKERHERKQKKKQEDYHRRKVMDRPVITFIPNGLTIDYEKEYARFFEQEVTYQPVDRDDFLYQFRLMNLWQEKSVPQIIELGRPDAAYAIAIELCRHIPSLLNRDDLQEYIKTYNIRIKKFILDSFSALVAAVKAWNNEEKRRYVSCFIFHRQQNQNKLNFYCL